MHAGNPGDLLAGAALLSLFFLMLGPVLGLSYLGMLIFSAIRCVRRCPENDLTAWLLVTILVPFGWAFYLAIGPKISPGAQLQATAPPPVLARPPVPTADDVAREVARQIRGG